MKAGRTQGISIKGLVNRLDANARKAINPQHIGDRMKGIIKMGLATTGNPKSSGSLTLNSDGMSEIFPTFLRRSFLKNKSINGTGRVEPAPPIHTNH